MQINQTNLGGDRRQIVARNQTKWMSRFVPVRNALFDSCQPNLHQENPLESSLQRQIAQIAATATMMAKDFNGSTREERLSRVLPMPTKFTTAAELFVFKRERRYSCLH